LEGGVGGGRMERMRGGGRGRKVRGWDGEGGGWVGGREVGGGAGGRMEV